MKILLINKLGSPRSISLGPWTGWATVLSFLAFCTSLFFSGVSIMKSEDVDEEVINNWRGQLAEQKERVVELQDKSEAQSQALGRQLAEMQGRLWRMEALASYMHESTGLPQDEFSFDESPAQGGPVETEQKIIAWADLESDLSLLSSRLERREKELGILDEVLLGYYSDAAARPVGRPVRQGWMSSPFGKRVDPITGRQAWHAGMDFAGKQGSEVITVANGVVTFAGRRDGYGLMVEVNHGNDMSTRYGHHEFLSVVPGQTVKRGDVIGRMGSSGRSTGPHVHFEVLRKGKALDPAKYVNRG
jgi:murein DD-endopeptidase MepM/ murein hydrolase activator NlpD